jgi:hypothetical protein
MESLPNARKTHQPCQCSLPFTRWPRKLHTESIMTVHMIVLAGKMIFHLLDVSPDAGHCATPSDLLPTADRGPVPPRDDLPLPTHPPYTAFVGNLAFDLDDTELAQFFGPSKVRSSLSLFLPTPYSVTQRKECQNHQGSG